MHYRKRALLATPTLLYSVAGEFEEKFQVSSVVKGYHVYKELWEATNDDVADPTY